MGADNDKKTAKKADKKPSSDDIQYVELSEEQEQLFGDTIATLEELGDEIKKAGVPIREFALGLTKLEEAEMWFQRGFEALGLDEDEDDEDADSEPAEDEEE
jgi:hypothetical protein